jgi:hypothetical protein
VIPCKILGSVGLVGPLVLSPKTAKHNMCAVHVVLMCGSKLSTRCQSKVSSWTQQEQLWLTLTKRRMCTSWCPSSLAKLVPITPTTMVYGRYNASIPGVYKPT